MAPAEQDLLLRVLQERDIPLTEDDIAWAFANNPARDLAISFVREYLDSSTLLTKDELDFFNRHGIQDTDPATSQGRPLCDVEWEASIEALEASTAAIERQSRILESQKKALQDIKSRNAAILNVHQDGRQKRFTREQAQLDLEIDELSQNITDRLLSASKQTQAATSSLPSQIDRLLGKDDRLLDGLQKLLPKVSDVAPAVEDSTSVDQLCSVLTSISVREIQARLNRAVREGIADYNQQPNGTTTKDLTEQEQKQIKTLSAELEELSGEIEGLVGIVVDHQYRKPLQRSQTSALVESHTQRTKWAEYAISALTYIACRLEAIEEHVQRLHAHDNALRTISATLQDVVAVAQPSKHGAGTAKSLSAPDRSNSKGLKPLRLVQANLPEGQDPALQFLRQHEIRVSDLDDLAKLADALEVTSGDRGSRVWNLSRSVEHSTTDSIVSSLAKVNGETQDLLRAVYTNSTSRTVRLVDRSVQENMNSLESDTQRLGDEMRDLAADSIAKEITAKEIEIVEKLNR